MSQYRVSGRIIVKLINNEEHEVIVFVDLPVNRELKESDIIKYLCNNKTIKCEDNIIFTDKIVSFYIM